MTCGAAANGPPTDVPIVEGTELVPALSLNVSADVPDLTTVTAVRARVLTTLPGGTPTESYWTGTLDGTAAATVSKWNLAPPSTWADVVHTRHLLRGYVTSGGIEYECSELYVLRIISWTVRG